MDNKENDTINSSTNSNVSSKTGSITRVRRVLTESQKLLREDLKKMCAYCFRKDIPLLKVRGSVIGDYIKEVVHPFFLTLFCAECVIKMYQRAKNENFASENSKGMIVCLDQSSDQSLEDYARAVVRLNINRRRSRYSNNSTTNNSVNNGSKRPAETDILEPDSKRSVSSFSVSNNSIETDSLHASQDVPRGTLFGGGLMVRKDPPIQQTSGQPALQSAALTRRNVRTSQPQNTSTSSEDSVSANTRQKTRATTPSSSDSSSNANVSSDASAKSSQSFGTEKNKKAQKAPARKRTPVKPPARGQRQGVISSGLAPVQPARIRTSDDGLRHIGG